MERCIEGETQRNRHKSSRSPLEKISESGTCGNRKLRLCSLSVEDKLRLIYSAKKPKRSRRPTELDNASAFIRGLVRSGADFNFHRRGARERDELGLVDADIRNMLWSGRLDRALATAAFEPPQFVFVGYVEQEKEDRRIQREFAITVAVERPQKTRSVGRVADSRTPGKRCLNYAYEMLRVWTRNRSDDASAPL